MVKYIKTLDDLNNAISLCQKSNMIMVLCFGSTWCGPCKKLLPNYIKLSENDTYFQKVQFYKIDVDDIDEVIIVKYSVENLPTTLIIKHNIIIKRIIGNNIELISDFLNKNS